MALSDSTTLTGLTTPMIDATDLKYQADPNFLPDKTSLHGPIESDGWIRAHNAIRFEISQLKTVFQKLSGHTLVSWQVTALQAWWAGHETHIHEHHSNEDDLFTPFLRTRINYPEKLEADHVELVALMDEIKAAVAALAEGSTINTLAGLWEKYEALMLPHLHEEEMVGLPLCRAYFTPAEIGKQVEKIMKGSDPVSMGSFIHVMGHKKDAMAFMKENGIPSFVWHIPGGGFKALRVLYRKKMQSHIDSLLAGKVVVALTKKHSAAIHAAADENAVAQSPKKKTGPSHKKAPLTSHVVHVMVS